MPPAPLNGTTVLDVSTHISGPYCTKLLSDYGAEVLKIEPPRTGDPARRLGPFYQDDPGPEKSLPFLNHNTGKKSLTLDLTTSDGQKILKALALTADLVVENHPPGIMDAWGLGYSELEPLNPKLVYTTITPYGQYGPHRDYLATDMTLFAMAGIMYRHGEPDREPLRYPGHVIQCLAGVNAAAASMCALVGARLTGRGMRLDIATIECLAGAADRQVLRHAYSHDSEHRQGHRREGFYPNGIYPCADGFVHVAALLSERGWVRVVHMLNMPALLTDPRFSILAARRQHHGDFDAIFYPWLIERTRQEIFQAGREHRVMVGMVYTMDEVLKDPQYAHRSYFAPVDHPVVGTHTYPGLPFKMTESPGCLRRAPLLGEHTGEVLHDRLGYSREQIARLRELGAV